MPYRTHLELTSGDRIALDATIDRIRTMVERKGASLAGPHTRPTEEVEVPLFKSHRGEGRFESWHYAIYRRELEVIGHEGVARELAAFDLPASIHVSLTIEDIDSPS
ncbi:MAG: 30S ribosomal protein S10 [Halobacteriota archaeon]